MRTVRLSLLFCVALASVAAHGAPHRATPSIQPSQQDHRALVTATRRLAKAQGQWRITGYLGLRPVHGIKLTDGRVISENGLGVGRRFLTFEAGPMTPRTYWNELHTVDGRGPAPAGHADELAAARRALELGQLGDRVVQLEDRRGLRALIPRFRDSRLAVHEQDFIGTHEPL